MQLLLETHLILWWQGTRARVLKAALDLIEATEDAVYVSRASLVGEGFVVPAGARGYSSNVMEHQRQLASWAMALALLPSLLFLGHWGVSIRIPAAGVNVVLVPASQAALGEHASKPQDRGRPYGDKPDGHGRHCHGDAASCSDVPFAGAGGFAVLRDFAVGLGMASGSVLAALMVHVLAALHMPSPERRPPRAMASGPDLLRIARLGRSAV